MKKLPFRFDPLAILLVILLALLTWWLVSSPPPQIDTFQSPLPILNYAKTVDRTQAQVNDILTYNILITNTGGPTTNTLVVDQLTSEMVWLGNITATYGIPSYDPVVRRVAWTGPLQPTSTLVISWSVMVMNVPVNQGNILTNTFTSVSDSAAVATRSAETTISTPTPRPTRTPTPTNTPTTTPTATATATPANDPPTRPLPISTAHPTYTATVSIWPKYLPETGIKQTW